MSSKKAAKRRGRAYQEIARLVHEMTCSDRDGCVYPDSPDMSYLAEHKSVCMDQGKMDQCRCSEKITAVHCQNAVNAENLAAAIVRAMK